MLTKTTFRRSVLPLASLLTLAIAGTARASDWEIDPAHTTATFSVRHLMVSTVKGAFEKVGGSVRLDEASPTHSGMEISIDAASVNTRNAQRDGHLKSPDFFGVKTNPKAKFESTKVEKTDKGYTITGNLTLNGKTKEVAIPAEVSFAGGTLKINGAVTIDKRDFGMTYGGGKIDDPVAIKVAVEAK